jgi:hypothetical protein
LLLFQVIITTIRDSIMPLVLLAPLFLKQVKILTQTISYTNFGSMLRQQTNY